MNVMARQHVFSKGMQQVLGLPDKRIPVIQTIQNNSLAATRCRRDVPFDAMTNLLPREDAYMIVIQIRGKNARELWLDGRPIKTEPLHAGGVVFHDLRQSPQFFFHDPLDSVNYFLRRNTLDIIAEDAGAPRISDLQFIPGVGVMDHVVAELTRLLLPVFDTPDRVSLLFADYVSLALGSHVAQAYGGMKSVVALRQGGLAAWQERRAKELISANLEGNLSTGDVARECSLSAGHFARAFRGSTGLSPHQWLVWCRVEKAHGLLRDGGLSLAEIARACGFADQSHFVRVFSQREGYSPGMWRRLHRS